MQHQHHKVLWSTSVRVCLLDCAKVSASLISAFASESEKGKARTLAELAVRDAVIDEPKWNQLFAINVAAVGVDAASFALPQEKRRLEDEEDIRLDALEADEEEESVRQAKAAVKQNAAAAERRKAERLAARQDAGQLRAQIDEMQAESQEVSASLQVRQPVIGRRRSVRWPLAGRGGIRWHYNWRLLTAWC